MMIYEIGDTVVHWTHGLGKVIAIEEMHLSGVSEAYYVVEVGALKLWIQTELANQGPLRFPVEGFEFRKLIHALQTSGEQLPNNPYKRKVELRERIQERTLADLCHLIRDLTDRSRHHTLNQNDSEVLYRAEEHFLDEWVLSLGTDRLQAQKELDRILRGDPSESVDLSR